MKKIIFYVVGLIILFNTNISFANIEGENLETNKLYNNSGSVIYEVKNELNSYSETIKSKYNKNLKKLKIWYKANNKSVEYLPFLAVKKVDFYSYILVIVLIMRTTVKFLTNKR
ncbi:MAG: hypothetical protein PHZ26_04535 [Candidatus Gracilibacteria bacterium]|nr:hypothetical protein [Candidatus Gracilibacteria bacterium]